MTTKGEYHTSYLIRKRIKSFLPKGVVKAIVALRGGGVRTQPAQESYAGNGDVLNCRVVYNEYGGFCIPHSSYTKSVAQSFYRGNQYEKETLEYIAAHCASGDVVHAGAYFGDMLPGLSRSRAAKDAIVWAFEPGHESFRCAEITCLLNNLDNVRLTHAGLGEQEKTVQLIIQDAAHNTLGGTSRVAKETDTAAKTEEITIKTVDGTIPVDRQISLLFFDVEGYESAVLDGAKATIDRCKPTIIIENNDEAGAAKLAELGYELVDELEMRRDRNVYRNAVFAPKK